MHVRRRTAVVHLHSDDARTKQQVPVPAVKLGCVTPPETELDKVLSAFDTLSEQGL